MNKKYVYGRENFVPLIPFALIILLSLFILSIYMIIDLGTSYGLLIGTIILFVVLLVFFIRNIKWRAWHNKIEKLGYKTEGRVVEFGYNYKSRDSLTDTPPMEKFWLEIMYIDKDGTTKRFKTPLLAFKPEKRQDITCDVYIYNNEILATNFENLNKKER